MKIKISMPKNLDKQILKAATDSAKKNGIDITCPTCEKTVLIKGSNPKCPNCGTRFDLNF